ncbi:MAG: DUF3368 domain-containing protein [Chloroflexi bacterium]|nr:DUF3368 domain-containing protein [Chloroflexota bacterium]
MDATDAVVSRPVLLDNTVLSNFAFIGRPALVIRRWPDAVCTTAQVLGEFLVGAARGIAAADTWKTLRIVQLTAAEADFADRLPPGLGDGERTCIAVAVHRRGVFASDDLAARRVALRLGVTIAGTVSILVESVQRGEVDRGEANAILGTMIAGGYRSPINRLDPLLEERG